MTSRLIDNSRDIAVLATRVEDLTGIPASHVERDFWVTEILRGVVTVANDLGIDVIFKGGTSLSKAYRLINRFSEDIDLLIIQPLDATTGQRDRVMKSLVAAAENTTLLNSSAVPEAITKGVKRAARFVYTSEYRPVGTGLSEGVLLELGNRGGSWPSQVMKVGSLIAEHLGELVGDAPEATPLNLKVLHSSRTLVEKFSILHTLHSGENERAATRAARHYYDIHQLLTHDPTIDGIRQHGMEKLAQEVETCSIRAEQNVVSRPIRGFALSPAFCDGPLVLATREQYEKQVLGQLLWPNRPRPSFDECIKVVVDRAESL